MSMEQLETRLAGNCPVCAAVIAPGREVEVTEILVCSECLSMLVVDDRASSRLVLGEAPPIEEDWGE